MNTALIPRSAIAEKLESVVIGGDLAKLTPDERVLYYRQVCESVGLNPLTKPFEYITLNGKLTLYARKDCTDQLRNINNISVVIAAREVVDECFVVTAQASTPAGRTDGSIGAVSIANLKGEAKCNAMMKAETKAKRRVTLSICGLGLLDETEIESIPASSKKEVKVTEKDEPIDIGGRGNGAAVIGEKDDEAASKTEGDSGRAPSPVMCKKEENTSFYAEVWKALPAELKPMHEDWGRAWLKDSGHISTDAKGVVKGSLKNTPKSLFPIVMREVMASIEKLKASLKQPPLPTGPITDDDVPF